MDYIEIDFEQIQAAFPTYKCQKVIGRGVFGKVFQVCDRQTDEKLALKKIKCFGYCEMQKKSALNQVRILASLDHPSIIKFVKGVLDSNEEDLYLFMQYAPFGDLSLLIQQAKDKKKRVSQSLIWSILLNIAEGLEYLHRTNIIHRDIKPANIFKSQNGYKIGDLNVSKIVGNGCFAKTQTGSPLYVSPQVWSDKEEGYDEKCDIWSLGIVAYELCCLRVPYQASSIEELKRKLKTTKLKNIPNGYSSNLNELIHQMLNISPKKRLSAERVKAICKHNLKLEMQETTVDLLSPLIDTISFPQQSEQRWINLVPLPPKSLKRECSRKDSVERQNKQNRSNIFYSDNRSLLIPKATRNSQEKSQNLGRVRLPAIRKKSQHEAVDTKSRQKSREKSRERSIDLKDIKSNRIPRKQSKDYSKSKHQLPIF